MTPRKKNIERSIFDRRAPCDRRTINFGAKYPGHDQRSGKNRRQSWEKRDGWKPINQWSSSPIRFNLSGISNAPWQIAPAPEETAGNNNQDITGSKG